MKRRFALSAALCGAFAAIRALPADTISATHVFPASLVYSRSFLEYVKALYAARTGIATSSTDARDPSGWRSCTKQRA